MNHYVAVNNHPTDRIAIYGTGDTPEAAIAVAASEGAHVELLIALLCTEALRREVDEDGTPATWGSLPDGTQCTDDEEQDADPHARCDLGDSRVAQALGMAFGPDNKPS